MLYRYLISVGSHRYGFIENIRPLHDGMKCFEGTLRPEIWEIVKDHLVGYQWEKMENVTQRYALFDDEFSAMLCEMEWPRTKFGGHEPFEDTITA